MSPIDSVVNLRQKSTNELVQHPSCQKWIDNPLVTSKVGELPNWPTHKKNITNGISESLVNAKKLTTYLLIWVLYSLVSQNIEGTKRMAWGDYVETHTQCVSLASSCSSSIPEVANALCVCVST